MSVSQNANHLLASVHPSEKLIIAENEVMFSGGSSSVGGMFCESKLKLTKLMMSSKL
jgi:hypothetical protein